MQGKIYDYSCANELYRQIMAETSTSYGYYHKKYLPIRKKYSRELGSFMEFHHFYSPTEFKRRARVILRLVLLIIYRLIRAGRRKRTKNAMSYIVLLLQRHLYLRHESHYSHSSSRFISLTSSLHYSRLSILAASANLTPRENILR